MKKLLLTFAFIFVGLVNAQAIDHKDYANDRKDKLIEKIIIEGEIISAYCIQGYVFIKTNEGSLTQIFRRASINVQIEAQPLKCEEYKKRNIDPFGD
jgi:hypothetical protein